MGTQAHFTHTGSATITDGRAHRRRRAADYGRATPSLRQRRPTAPRSEGRQPPRHSHLDCRYVLILIVARQTPVLSATADSTTGSRAESSRHCTSASGGVVGTRRLAPVAEAFPGRQVVVFRCGPGASPSGGRVLAATDPAEAGRPRSGWSESLECAAPRQFNLGNKAYAARISTGSTGSTAMRPLVRVALYVRAGGPRAARSRVRSRRSPGSPGSSTAKEATRQAADRLPSGGGCSRAGSHEALALIQR